MRTWRGSAILVTLLMLASGAAASGLPAAQAQGGDEWFAYLYDATARQLMAVDANGAQQAYSLGLADNEQITLREVAFSADGSRAAYCLGDFTATTPERAMTLYVRDVRAETNLLALDLGQRVACRVSPAGISPLGDLALVGLLNRIPGIEVSDPTRPAWQLLLVDVGQGTILAELNADAPNAPLAPGGRAPALPDVRYYYGPTVIFTLVPYAVDTPLELDAHLWNLEGGVLPGGHWGQSGLSVLSATGEQVWLTYPAAQRPANRDQPAGFYTAVMVTDDANQPDESRVIYATSEGMLVDTQFIDGGRRIALLVLPVLGPNPPDPGRVRWIALDRAGNVSELPTGPGLAQLGEAPGGYAAFSEERDDTHTTYRFGVATGGEFKVVWEAEVPTASGFWGLAWTRHVPAAADLPPFPPFAP